VIILSIKKTEFLNIIGPIFLGLIIYIFFREIKPEVLLKIMSILDINYFYSYNITDNKNFNSWFVYCLPDGLWAYSITNFIIFTNKNETSRVKKYYLCLTYAIISLQEFLQGIFLPGTFDVYDVVNLNAGYFLALLVSGIKKET